MVASRTTWGNRIRIPGMVLLLTVAAASAQDVRVTKEAAGRASIDWTGWGPAETPAAREFIAALRASLVRSGWFSEARPGAGEFRLTGRAGERRGQLEVECEVRSPTRSVLRRTYRADPGQARVLAHRASDDIVEAVTGRPGFATSRLLLVGNRTGHKELYVSASDGQDLRQITRDGNLSLYPRWTPDGRGLLYVGYLRAAPDLFQIDLVSGERRRVSGFPGLNAGGAMSNDGRSMALILSRDGNPELYVRDVGSGSLTRLTHTPRAAESSPSWSPDGNRLVYVSDLSGAPQLYLLDRRGGPARRLTSRGRENVAPDWGSNGWIVHATRVGSSYGLALTHPDTGETRTLALPPGDWEDPTWARDGRHVAASRKVGRRSSIWLIDTMTGESVPLVATNEGDWFSPAWSP